MHLAGTQTRSKSPHELNFLPCEVGQGCCYRGKAPDELIVIVRQAKELLYLLLTCWNRPFADGFRLCWAHGNLTSGYHMPKVLQLFGRKLTLACFSVQLMLT